MNILSIKNPEQPLFSFLSKSKRNNIKKLSQSHLDTWRTK